MLTYEHLKGAEPVATANGPKRPWLISNVSHMKKSILLTIALITSVCAISAESRPNLHAPELTARDLADLLNIRVVKGRLPNMEGFRIEAYELLFRDDKGAFHAISRSPTPYKYDEFKKDDVGELTIALKEEKEVFEITIIGRNYAGSQKHKFKLKKPDDYAMIYSHAFRGESGKTVDDLMNIVEIGDQDIFTFHKKDAAPEAKPAALVIRTYRKK